MKNKITILLIVLSLLSTTGCEKKAETKKEETIRLVKYVTANAFEKEIENNFTGNISSVSETKLSFKVNGNIKKIYVSLGEKVKEGQLIAEIDSKDYGIQYQTAENNLSNAKIGVAEANARLSQANAGYEQSKNSVEQAKTAVENSKVQYASILKKYERIAKMYEDGNVSVEDFENIKLARDSAKLNLDNSNNLYEQAKTGVKNALATIEQAKAGINSAEAVVNTVSKNVEMAKLQVDYTKLISPVDGFIAVKVSQENENIAAGTPIVVINSGTNLEVKIFVPEAVVSNLKIGQIADIKVDAAEGKTFKGKIKDIGNMSTGFGITFPVVIALSEGFDKLKAGMTAEAMLKIPNNLKKRSLVVQPNCIGKDTYGNFVYIIEKGNGDIGILRKRKVKTGEISNDGIEILDGIKSGDLVLAAGIRFADEGLKVKIPVEKGE